MRLSELNGKEIVAVDEGTRVGVVTDVEVLVETETGRVEALVSGAPAGGGFSRWTSWLAAGRSSPYLIPWVAVGKIGPDLIVIEQQQLRNLPPHLRNWEWA